MKSQQHTKKLSVRLWAIALFATPNLCNSYSETTL